MTPQRRYQLECTSDAQLSDLELEQGYHFCAEWDYMIVGPEHLEWETCLCKFKRDYENRNKKI